MAQKVGSLLIEIGANVARLQRDMGRVTSIMDQNAQRWQRTMKNAGAAIAGYFAFDNITRGLGATIDAFAVLDQGLIGVKKTTGLTGGELSHLGQDIQAITKRLPLTTQELLGITQAAGQLGVKGSADLLNFTEVVGMLGTASDLHGEEAAMVLARLLTVTGESSDQVDELGSVIVALGNNMAATESEIARMATEVGQATAQFEVSSAEAAALGAAMRSMGIRAELGGSSVGRAMRAIDAAIREGGDSFAYLSKLTGIAEEDLERTFKENAVSVFQAFVEGLGRAIAAGHDVSKVLETFGLKGEEVMKVLPAMGQSAELLGRALEIANREMAENTALTDEATEAAKSYNAQTQIQANRVEILASKVGSELAPAWLSMKEVGLGVVDMLIDLNSWLSRTSFMWGEFAEGRINILDPALWSNDAAKQYIENLSTAIGQYKRELKSLENYNYTADSISNGLLGTRFGSQEEAEKRKQWLRDEIAHLEDMKRVAKDRAELENALRGAATGSVADPVNAPPPPPGGDDDDDALKSLDAYLTRFNDAYAEMTLTKGQYLQYQLNEEQKAYQASEEYLEAHKTKQDETDAAFNAYRTAREHAFQKEAAQEEAARLRGIAQAAGRASAEYARLTHDTEGYYAAQVELLKIEQALAQTEEERALIAARLAEAQAHASGDWVWAAKDALRDYEDTAGDVFANTASMVTNMASTLEDSITNAFVNGEFAAEDFFNAIYAEVVKMQVAKPIAAGISGGISDLFEGIGLWHDGGVVGHDSPTAYRSVNPLVFAGAPRLHSGLMPDEFPAILQKGETVLPRDYLGGSAPSMPSVELRVIVQNEDGGNTRLEQAGQDMSFDGEKWFATTFLRVVRNDVGGVRTAMQRGL